MEKNNPNLLTQEELDNLYREFAQLRQEESVSLDPYEKFQKHLAQVIKKALPKARQDAAYFKKELENFIRLKERIDQMLGQARKGGSDVITQEALDSLFSAPEEEDRNKRGTK